MPTFIVLMSGAQNLRDSWTYVHTIQVVLFQGKDSWNTLYFAWNLKGYFKWSE